MSDCLTRLKREGEFMSLFAQYLTERSNDRILELEQGFATYRMLPDQKAIYLIDIFVHPDLRHSNLASSMADKVADIGKKEGYTKMVGSIIPSTKNSTAALKIALAYGMKLSSSAVDFIALEKDL